MSAIITCVFAILVPVMNPQPTITATDKDAKKSERVHDWHVIVSTAADRQAASAEMTLVWGGEGPPQLGSGLKMRHTDTDCASVRLMVPESA